MSNIKGTDTLRELVYEYGIDHLDRAEVGLDMYGLNGYVSIFENDGVYEDDLVLAASLNIYPEYKNFFTEEEMDSVNIAKVEQYYDAYDEGVDWFNSSLEVYLNFHPDTPISDALGALFDKANPLINDLLTGRFEDVVRSAMED